MTTKARITLQVALIIAAVATPASAARQTLTASYDRVMLDRNKTSEANLLRSSIPLRESSSNSSWNRSESDSENKNGPFHNEANSRGTLEWRHQDKAISLG
ncbi:MAG: hypothetical protein LBD43_00500, partial [Holosporales bacterium]|nr:hypothetical protein [Holosporales bacterium]